MLREVAALFDSPHMLTLLRPLGEATEQLIAQTLPVGVSPLAHVRCCSLRWLHEVAVGGGTQWRRRPRALCSLLSASSPRAGLGSPYRGKGVRATWRATF